MSRNEALKKVWRVLGNPMVMMSKPEREEALKIAHEHKLLVSELMAWLFIQRRRA